MAARDAGAVAARDAGAGAARPTSTWTRVGDVGVHARSWASPNVPADPAVVLVHGLGIASRMCRPVAERLASRFHVHAPDLPGFGESGRPARVLDVPALGAALAAWMAASGLGRSVVVGTSLGCQVAAHAAVRDRGRCRLVVLGSPTFEPARRGWRPLLARGPLELASQSAALQRTGVADIARAGPWRVARTLAAALDDALEETVARLPQPLLVCWAGRDPLVSRAWAAQLVATAPDGELAVLPGAFHALSHESPLPYARVIAHFIDAHDGGGPAAPPG